MFTADFIAKKTARFATAAAHNPVRAAVEAQDFLRLVSHTELPGQVGEMANTAAKAAAISELRTLIRQVQDKLVTAA